MCASCGCNHINYQHEMPKVEGSSFTPQIVETNMPKVPVVPAMPKSIKKVK
jgi:hypothetical protein